MIHNGSFRRTCCSDAGISRLNQNRTMRFWLQVSPECLPSVSRHCRPSRLVPIAVYSRRRTWTIIEQNKERTSAYHSKQLKNSSDLSELELPEPLQESIGTKRCDCESYSIFWCNYSPQNYDESINYESYKGTISGAPHTYESAVKRAPMALLPGLLPELRDRRHHRSCTSCHCSRHDRP